MSRFFIKKITVSGKNALYSEILFNDGVNIVYGPSNSGKSYIINCIDFMFAGQIPFTKAATGYDTVSIYFESTDGDIVSMERKIIDGKNGETGARVVDVRSDYEHIKSQEYKISGNGFSDVMLRLMGINSSHKIISDDNYNVQSVTIRQLMHFFFINEENILMKSTTFDTPKYNKINASLCLLNFLISGDDSIKLVPKESKKERENRVIQRKGILNYINHKLNELNDRKQSLKIKNDIKEIDLEQQIDQLFIKISEIEDMIIEATDENKLFFQKIYEVNLKLEEAMLLKKQYINLKSQYNADIKRLKFILDGEIKEQNIEKIEKCPFCKQEISADSKAYESYVEVASIELKRTRIQMNDLIEAELDVDSRIEDLEEKRSLLNEKIDKTNAIIEEELTPKADKLKQMVIEYKDAQKIEQEIISLDIMAEELNKDATEKENEVDPEFTKFSGRDLINEKIWQELSDSLSIIIRECGYPNNPKARIDINTVDAVVNGKYKKDEGKGYRAFINTIMLLNLMKFLEHKAVYAPRMLILDSPILSLKEKKHNISNNEKISLGMRERLFEYIVNNCGNNQIIIAENEIPNNVDYSTANLIEFTLDNNKGRYGFLKGIE